MDGIYKNVKEYSLRKEHKIVLVFDDMIAEMLSNKKVHSIATQLFKRSRNLNIFLVFIARSYFVVPKYIRINSTHYFVMKIPTKQELQQITFNGSSDIDSEDFISLYKKCTAKTYSFLVIDTFLVSDNPFMFENIIF